jgi:hypothetical protein
MTMPVATQQPQSRAVLSNAGCCTSTQHHNCLLSLLRHCLGFLEHEEGAMQYSEAPWAQEPPIAEVQAGNDGMH